MRLSVPDIPRRAAAVAVALALIASIVSGVEGPSDDAKAGAAPQKLPAAPGVALQSQALPALDLKKLTRGREGKKVPDLFPQRALLPPAPVWPPPATTAAVAPPTPPAPPPEPTAPAL